MDAFIWVFLGFSETNGKPSFISKPYKDTYHDGDFHQSNVSMIDFDQKESDKWKTKGYVCYDEEACRILHLLEPWSVEKEGYEEILFDRALRNMGHCKVVRWKAYKSQMDFYFNLGATHVPGSWDNTEHMKIDNKHFKLWKATLHSLIKNYYGKK